MRKPYGLGLIAAAMLIVMSSDSLAGGAWVPEPGHGWFSVGFNRKSGDRRLDADGSEFIPGRGRTHDFRYGYFSGEAGLIEKLSVNWTLTYLWGTESFDDPADDFSHQGFSDTWVGMRYRLRSGSWPMVAEVNARLPYLYEHNEEWLGLLKHDFTGLLFTERATERAGTFAGYGGYTIRQGSPTDQVRLGMSWAVPNTVPGFERLPFQVTVGLDGFISVGEPSPSEPSDRFGYRPRTPDSENYFTFNKSTWVRPFINFSRPIGNTGYGMDVGYGRIGPGDLGRNVHQYNDLYFGVYHSF
ncbi:MAG TPA: hypothetical protein VGB99_00975 [Acidobacteriota bacterium]